MPNYSIKQQPSIFYLNWSQCLATINITTNLRNDAYVRFGSWYWHWGKIDIFKINMWAVTNLEIHYDLHWLNGLVRNADKQQFVKEN